MFLESRMQEASGSHFLTTPSWRNGIRAALRTQCPRDIPVRVRGKGPTDRRGRSGRGKRDPKTLKRESRKGYAGNQPRHVVADAPNGYFSGSLGKRVSKPTLSSSNDRSSAMCRFESCRPHHGSLAQLAEHPVLTRQVEGSIPSRSTNSRDELVAQG